MRTSIMLSVIAGFLACESARAHGKDKHHGQPAPIAAPTAAARTAVIQDIAGDYAAQVAPIFETKCMDCHSSQTRFPWYHALPGIRQLLEGDVREGRRHLDLTAGFPFGGHGTDEETLNAIAEAVTSGSMPPFAYRLLHPTAKLTSEETEIVRAWAERSVKRLKYLGGFVTEIKGPAPVSELGHAACSRLGISRRDAARHSYYLLHAMGEVIPSDKRYVSLGSQSDGFGRPIPVIQWAWEKNDQAVARAMEDGLAEIAEALCPRGGVLIPIRGALDRAGNGHEAGTCRMGTRETNSVTNSFGQVHGSPHVYIADASLFPTSLDRHPTFTLLALVARIARHLATKG